MAVATIYLEGLDLLRDWETADYRFLLLQGSGYVVNASHEYVSDLNPGSNEVSASGYSRAAMTNPNRAQISGDIFGAGGLRYDCNDPSFGTPSSGQTVTGIVLYKLVTNDSDSPLVSYYPLDAPTTGDSFIVQIPYSGVVFRRQGSLT